MVYLMFSAVLFIFLALMALLLLLIRGSARSERAYSPNHPSEKMYIVSQAPTNGSRPYSPATQQPLPPQQAFPPPGSLRYADYETRQTPQSAQAQNALSNPPRSQGPTSSAPYTRSQPALGALPRNLYDRNSARMLEMEYEQGMFALYDPYIRGTNFVITNVVMKNPAEVALAFQVCTRKIQIMLRQRGLERAPLLTDIAGLVIGGDATTAWGQALKTCFDTICIKVGKDIYVLAHYNSRASQPSREQLQEKVRNIQFMTSAVLNNFQSNIFDTREEAIAFLLRMKELHHIR